jgi:cyclophilin family peptidyl-prolyl cis-trans isomerase
MINYRIAIVAAVVIAPIVMILAPALRADDAKAQQKKWDKPPEMKIDVNKKYTATIDTTAGKIVVDLFPKEAPKTVNNFVFLAREKFYDGTIFHRVIPNFMIQGGDPTGTGRGGPGYKFENENKDSQKKFDAGTLAMANAGPDTNGSQFFINDADSPWLTPDKYTIFGHVKEGQDVVKAIAAADRDESDRPKQEIKIESITIEEK